MLGRLWSKVSPSILWRYSRGSWQWDVMVALILAFIFLVPRSAFNDRPSEPVVQELANPSGTARVFWVDPGALGRSDPEGTLSTLPELLPVEDGHSLRILKAEPAQDAAGNTRAFIVYAER